MKNKTMTIVLIVILSIIAISLIVAMILMINGKFHLPNFRFNYKTSNELQIDETYQKNFKKIKIQADSSEVEIKTSKEQDIKVKVYAEKEMTTLSTKEEELLITSKEKKCIGFCFHDITKIEVTVPEDYQNKIEIENKYGDVKIENVIYADIEVNEDCGDVDIEGGNNITVNNNYGDIKIEKANNVVIREDCGDVKIDTINQEADIKNQYGDIHIKKVGESVNIKNNCGDIKIDNLVITKNSILKDDLGNIKIGMTNDIYIDAKTDLGDIKINRNDHKSDITLKIENNCGDIKVNN